MIAHEGYGSDDPAARGLVSLAERGAIAAEAPPLYDESLGGAVSRVGG